MAVVRNISIKVEEKNYLNFLGSLGYVGYDDATKEDLEFMVDDVLNSVNVDTLMVNWYVKIEDETIYSNE